MGVARFRRLDGIILYITHQAFTERQFANNINSRQLREDVF